MPKPSTSDLAYLSQLYNERRYFKLKRKDLERLYVDPIRNEYDKKLKVAHTQIDSEIKKQEEHVRSEICKLKIKFRMRVGWDLSR